MQVPRASIILFLVSFCLLPTFYQGPTYVLAGNGPKRPGFDPLFFYRGNSGGARPPRRPPPLSTIYEEVTPQGSPTGAGARGRRTPPGDGTPPLTHFRFQD
ncbi:hypothetical protein MTO96_003833 [Rhipicephalus appendiculatus]